MLKQLLMEWAVKQKWKKMRVREDFSVEAYLNNIVDFFDPEKAADRRLVVVYEFHDSGENDGAWTITIAEGKCTLTKGEAKEYDTKLYMTAETYRRILTGRLDFARHAYSTGAVRFYGNTLGHRELNDYITLPRNATVLAL